MRGKFVLLFAGHTSANLASMRPAHYAREVARGADERTLAGQASMRPAHYAREVVEVVLQPSAETNASMRPAHYAREVAGGWRRCLRRSGRFNEARALCAGSFRRPADALAAGLASMRPAHYAREVGV